MLTAPGRLLPFNWYRLWCYRVNRVRLILSEILSSNNPALIHTYCRLSGCSFDIKFNYFSFAGSLLIFQHSGSHGSHCHWTVLYFQIDNFLWWLWRASRVCSWPFFYFHMLPMDLLVHCFNTSFYFTDDAWLHVSVKCDDLSKLTDLNRTAWTLWLLLYLSPSCLIDIYWFYWDALCNFCFFFKKKKHLHSNLGWSNAKNV